MNESCRTYECAMSRICIRTGVAEDAEAVESSSHVTLMIEPCHANAYVKMGAAEDTKEVETLSHVTCINESCHTYECATSRKCIRTDGSC